MNVPVMPSPDPTLAERSARYRARKAGTLPAVPSCPSCGSKVHKLQLRPGGLCRRCWMKTPEGREYQRLRVAEFRAKAKRKAKA